MNRLRDLFLHADPRVRRRAIEAVGALGDGESPLEALVNHLNVATESNEAVRSAAWDAFCTILQRQSAETRLEWADRLKDLPGRQIEYLTALVDDFTSANPVPAQLDEARDLLIRLLREQGRYAESVRHLQERYAALSANGDPRAGKVGVMLLDSRLRNGQHNQRINQLLSELASHADDTKAAVVQTVKTYLDTVIQDGDGPELEALVQRLRLACAGLYGQPFDRYLEEVIHSLTAPPTTGPAERS